MELELEEQKQVKPEYKKVYQKLEKSKSVSNLRNDLNIQKNINNANTSNYE